MAGRPSRITIQIEGTREDRGHVRLQDFVRQLDLLRTALKVTDRDADDGAAVYWRIVDLRHSSPATIVLEEVSSATRGKAVKPEVGSRLLMQIGKINRSAKAFERETKDLATLEAYRELGSITERHIEKMVLKVGSKTVSIAANFRTHIDTIIGPDELLPGAIYGRVEVLNFHNALKFNIYPMVGPRKVVCDFPQWMKPKVIGAVDRYVTVRGFLKYKQWSKFPHAASVEDIDVHPLDKDLPTLEDLRGEIPDATGDLMSEDFIEALRDGSW